MKKFWLVGCLVFAACFSIPAGANGGPKKKRDSNLEIRVDPATSKVVLAWEGKGVLRQASISGGKLRKVPTRPSPRRHELALPAADAGTVFVLQPSGGGNGSIVTQNIVGYVNLDVPPGLSLFANPLYYTTNSVSFWMREMPDGSQVFKLRPDGTYEISTFDSLAGGWSNPDLELPLGTGFHFYNPTAETLRLLFVGEVLQGELINPLPAGVSMKGSLVPQAGSIQVLHRIPGEPGDEFRVYINDLQGGGGYQSSFYVEGAGWVPDRDLGVGQGFYILKQHPQDWVRFFSAF